MRRMLIMLMAILSAGPAGAVGVVNNSTVAVSGEDSVAVAFRNLDSLGQGIGGLDTTHVLVLSGAGEVVFSETITGLGGRVEQHASGSDTSFCWSAQVSDIDGDGAPGVYTVVVSALSDQTGGWLRSPVTQRFQLVGWEFDAMGDSTGAAARGSAQALDSLGKTLDQLYTAVDSLQAVLDTLQAGFGSQVLHDVNLARISGDPVAADALEAILDGTGGGSLTLSHVDITPLFGPAVRVVSNDTGIVVYTSAEAPAICAHAEGSGLVVSGGAGFGDIVADLKGSVDTVLGEPDSLALAANDKQVLAGLVADSVLTDSGSYQGAGAPIDSADIARWVWNTPQANHEEVGSFGDYLDAEISGLSMGSGIYAVAIQVLDSSTGQPVPGVDLAVRNLQQTALLAVGRTDSDGRVGFNLDAGSLVTIARAAGYLFHGCDTTVVVGGGTDTIYGLTFDPGLPTSPSLCRVYGLVYDVNGYPLGGVSVTASLPAGVSRAGSIVVSPLPVAAETDSTGYFYLDLIPSTLLVPVGTRYEITVGSSDGLILRRRVDVPDQGSWQLTW